MSYWKEGQKQMYQLTSSSGNSNLAEAEKEVHILLRAFPPPVNLSSYVVKWIKKVFRIFTNAANGDDGDDNDGEW
jgi:hypothetical protein